MWGQCQSVVCSDLSRRRATLNAYGNGRIARALSEMAMSQDENSATRFYSLSSKIQRDVNDYYGFTGKGNGDITRWLEWYLRCMVKAMDRSGIC